MLYTALLYTPDKRHTRYLVDFELDALASEVRALAQALGVPQVADLIAITDGGNGLWARGLLSASPHFQPGWVLEYLDSRHADVRAEGWQWLCEDARASDNVDVWRKLLESPYDDVRLLLIADLEKRTSGGVDPRRADNGRLDDELVRFLWASVLLNIHRGGRTKPVVVGQLVRRLTHRPDEARALLPILAVALRSLRGPEWRAGLAGVVPSRAFAVFFKGWATPRPWHPYWLYCVRNVRASPWNTTVSCTTSPSVRAGCHRAPAPARDSRIKWPAGLIGG
jgi:hypothetical protein